MSAQTFLPDSDVGFLEEFHSVSKAIVSDMNVLVLISRTTKLLIWIFAVLKRLTASIHISSTLYHKPCVTTIEV